MVERSCAVTSAKVFGTFFPLLSICVVAFGFLQFKEKFPPEVKTGLSIFAAFELFLLYVVFFESKMLLPVGIGISILWIIPYLIGFLIILGLGVKEFFSEHETSDTSSIENFFIVDGVLLVLTILHIKRAYCVWIMYKWSRDPTNPKSTVYQP